MNGIPNLARVSLEIVTPLHIGSGREVVWEKGDWAKRWQVVRIERADGEDEPYIPGSSLKGMVRSLYEFACELEGMVPPDSATIFGTVEGQARASQILFSDLHTPTPVNLKRARIKCVCPHDSDCRDRKHRDGFDVELVPKGQVFQGEVAYYGNTLRQVLDRLFRQRDGLVRQLTVNGKSVEIRMAKRGYTSEITRGVGGLFPSPGDSVFTFTWKLGKYAKQYAKVLAQGCQPRSGKPRSEYHDLPYAFVAVPETRELLGWVRITFDLLGARPFVLNE
jgi:hypothetical protein